MFKITALLTMLALGSSASVALASSSRSYNSRAGVERTRIEHTRVERSDRLYRSGSRGGAGDDFGPRRYRPTWVALSAPLQLTHTGRDSIEVTDDGTFTQLRLQTLGGIARVDRVIVQIR